MSKACGWDGEWGDEFYRFFDPSYMEMELYEPFQFSWERLYSYNLFDEKFATAPNIAEWAAYFGNEPSQEEIRYLVYNFSVEAIEGLTKGKTEALSPGQRTNSLVKRFLNGELQDALTYLLYAKRCEPFCVSGNEWGSAPANAAGSEHLVDEGRRAYAAVSGSFLKQRYAYQIVRLLRYNFQFPQAMRAYQQYALPLANEPTTIYWWTRAHYAGALRNIKREALAAYEFSRVFDESPTRRIQAYYSFRIRSEAIWNEALNLCKNGREKATLYFLRGIQPDALPIEEIRTIQVLDPGSDQADVLLLREINKLEADLLGYPFQRGTAEITSANPDVREARLAHLAKLKALVQATIASNKMHDPSLWQLSEVYLTFLGGEQESAAAQLRDLRPGLKGDAAFRGSMLDLVFRIAMTKQVNPSVENKLLMDLTNLSRDMPKEKAEELRKFMDEAFAWLYKAQGQPAKAILAANKQYAIWETADIATVNDLLKFEAKGRKTLYEKQLWSRMPAELDRYGLIELKGTRLMAKNMLPEAIKNFEALPAAYREKDGFQLPVDPFKGNIKDIVNCDAHGCTEYKYNKLTFAKALLTLTQKAATDPENAPEYYHLLGNATYNITYFGPAWRALDYSRSGASWYYIGRQESWYSFNVEDFPEHIEMETPHAFYVKSMELSKDPELAALSCFMAAKCEQNEFYMSDKSKGGDYNTHFAQLLRNYRNTAIYDKLIQECSYLRSYANNH